MSRKIEQKIINLDSDMEFESVNLQNCYSYGCQVSISNGSGFSADLVLEVSNDKTEWIVLPTSPTTLSGSSDSQIYDVVQATYGYVRVNLSNVAGSADITINYVLK